MEDIVELKEFTVVFKDEVTDEIIKAFKNDITKHTFL